MHKSIYAFGVTACDAKHSGVKRNIQKRKDGNIKIGWLSLHAIRIIKTKANGTSAIIIAIDFCFLFIKFPVGDNNEQL